MLSRAPALFRPFQALRGAVAATACAALCVTASAATAGTCPLTASDLNRLAPDLPMVVAERALRAAEAAQTHGDGSGSSVLTVIDYTKPSTEKRLWVFDLAAQRLLFHELVAHGKNSGDNETVSFSNRLGSRQTSLGLFMTGESYLGDNGYSLRLRGLDPGFNCRAEDRAVVLHGAPYVSEAFARRYGRLGRSWGCPAVPQPVARPLIDAIKGGSFVFAYGSDREWLTALDAKLTAAAAAPTAVRSRAPVPPR